MKKNILVLGAGRSATSLIDYLKNLLGNNNWTLTVADHDLKLAAFKTGNAAGTTAVQIDIMNDEARELLIKNADVVISMLPPSMHLPVAKDCCQYRKHLLTASYISEDIRKMSDEIERADILFLCEMGLDPGIDHMSAMQIIDRLHYAGADIESFKSHCGGLVALESDDNPWHYKISWNAANIVKAGADGAVYKENNIQKSLQYKDLFRECGEISIPSMGNYAFYPNRDSLNYLPTYGLETAKTFIRTTLRHPQFCSGWHLLVQAELTSQAILKEDKKRSFESWSSPLLPYLTAENKQQFDFLGLFDQGIIPATYNSSAAILQYLLEKKLMLQEKDKDMIIMLHEFIFTLEGKRNELKSLLIVKGEDNLYTAMAKTVGLPLGIAAKLLLQDKIKTRGLQIPVRKEIYESILSELKAEGICFQEEQRVIE